MKIRAGFVSNSSSSSFTCTICGREESGWDMCLSEAEFIECEKGHIFCGREAIKHWDNKIKNSPQFKIMLQTYLKESSDEREADLKIINEFVENIDEFVEKDNFADQLMMVLDDISDGDFRYDIAPFLCPVCGLDYIEDTTIMDYLLFKLNITRNDVVKEIHENANTLEQLYDKIK